MIVTKFGEYEIVENVLEAFDLAVFEEKYIEEVYDKYTYVLGDISGGILRLKGFSSDPKSKNSHLNIPTFLEESCAYSCPYYVLKRKKKKENNDE